MIFLKPPTNSRPNLFFELRLFPSGFSLVEIIVVTALMSILSTLFIFNFRSANTTKTGHDQVVGVIVSDTRRMQSLALSGRQYNSENVCGYGIHYVDAVTYILYVVRDVNADGFCSDQSRLYSGGSATILETHILANPSVQFQTGFQDIYFELPFAKTYINNVNSPPTSTQIILQNKGSDCTSGFCSTVTVTTAGAINL